MSIDHRRMFWGLSLIALLLFAVGMLLPVGHLQAQPRATLEARSQMLEQTSAAVRGGVASIQETALAGQSSLESRVTDAASTVEAMQTSVVATADAIRSQGQDYIDTVASTMQYVATTVNLQAEHFQATATAISHEIQARLDALPPEVADLLDHLVQQASVTYDSDTGTLNAVSYITEQQANDLLDILVEAAGYNPAAVSLDMRTDGTIQIVLVDVSGELPGTVVMTYQIAVTDGHLSAVLVAVTLNGVNIPVDSIPEDLLSAAQLAIEGAAQQIFVNYGQSPLTYEVKSVSVSEDSILVEYVVQVE